MSLFLCARLRSRSGKGMCVHVCMRSQQCGLYSEYRVWVTSRCLVCSSCHLTVSFCLLFSPSQNQFASPSVYPSLSKRLSSATRLARYAELYSECRMRNRYALSCSHMHIAVSHTQHLPNTDCVTVRLCLVSSLLRLLLTSGATHPHTPPPPPVPARLHRLLRHPRLHPLLPHLRARQPRRYPSLLSKPFRVIAFPICIDLSDVNRQFE